MNISYAVLTALAALALAQPAAAQTGQPSSDPQMPAAPAGLGARITSGVQTLEPAYPVPTPIAVSPSQLSAAQIRQLQQGLRAQGLPLSRIDGVFGPETESALQNFQARQNMASAPGQIDSRTLDMLGVTAPGTTAGGRATPSSGLSTPLAGSATRRR